MSFKTEILAFHETKWVSNGVRFATADEAEAAGQELSMRWFALDQWRAAESDEPVNYKFENGKSVAL
jgi:hypothetical protein